MRSVALACIGALSLAACSGNDHSLGMGVAPAQGSTGDGHAMDTAASSGGAVVSSTPDAMAAAGGARSGISDKGVFTSGGGGAAGGAGGVAIGGAGGATASDTGGTTSAGGVGTGGGTGDKFIGVGVSSSRDPVIPPVSGECPTWANGTITFMGLGGIQIAVGAKPQGPTGPMLVYWQAASSYRSRVPPAAICTPVRASSASAI
jgi:hypothetical protein